MMLVAARPDWHRSFKAWGLVFGENVIVAALLDSLLHRATVLEFAGNSYRLREHADLIPESVNRGGKIEEPAIKRKPGRLRKQSVDLEKISRQAALGWGNFNWNNWGVFDWYLHMDLFLVSNLPCSIMKDSLILIAHQLTTGVREDIDLLFEAPVAADLPGEDAPGTVVKINGMTATIIGIDDLIMDRLRPIR